jgi:hypothetical protein
MPLRLLERVLNQEVNPLQLCPRSNGDIIISFIKFLKIPKVYKIVGSQHYVPVVSEILSFGKALLSWEIRYFF